MTAQPDVLLLALEQMDSIIHWYAQRGTSLSAADAMASALDDWISEHADDEQGSQRIRSVVEDPTTEPLGIALARFTATITNLVRVSEHTDLMAADALTEALGSWTAIAATEHHQSRPFTPPSSVEG